jgi:amidase
MTDYAAHDGLGLAELVARRDAAPAELLAAARERADAVDPGLNAIVRRLGEHADARAAGALSGPFAGVPFLLKDLFQDIEGIPTSNGCRALARVPAQQTSTVVRRWLEAGLVVFGKTNTPEFGAKGITEPDLFGPCRNPWDAGHSPGGSSGGAAAAVAAGIVPVAGASDGGGSIRIPAACCGLFGLKASRGLIPSGPAVGEALHGSGVQGVISRTVRDTAAMLDVLAGPDAASPYAPGVKERPFLDEVGADPERLRIGWYAAGAINPEPHPEARAAVQDAAALLEELGHDVEELPAAPYDDAELARDFLAGWFVNAASIVRRIKELTGAGDDGFEQDTLMMAELGRATSGVELWEALERRQHHVLRLADFHARHDLLLTPALATPPPRVGQFDTPAPLRLAGRAVRASRAAGHVLPRLGIVDRMIEDNLGWVPYTQLANLTGRPAMSVPLHWTAEGLPLGVQFVAPLSGEPLLLRLAAQLEEARPWAERRPPV